MHKHFLFPLCNSTAYTQVSTCFIKHNGSRVTTEQCRRSWSLCGWVLASSKTYLRNGRTCSWAWGASHWVRRDGMGVGWVHRRAMGLQWALQVVMRELWDDAGRVARWAEQQ